jgi:hypothetical protein
MSYYDDNFGLWEDMDDPDTREYYNYVQRISVDKECNGCGRIVRILPNYGYCDSCASMRESGIDF